MTKRKKTKNNGAVVLLAKNLIPNFAKTRIIEKSSVEQGFEIYKDLLIKTLLTLHHPRFDALVLFTHYKEFVDSYLKSTPIGVQTKGGLTDKIEHAFQSGFDSGYSKVAVIGSDCPYLTQDIILHGFTLLEKSDLVFGPSTDGGFYLIAAKSFNRNWFQDVEWSTVKVLEQCLVNAKQHNLSVSLLPTLKDIDELEDWEEYLEKN